MKIGTQRAREARMDYGGLPELKAAPDTGFGMGRTHSGRAGSFHEQISQALWFGVGISPEKGVCSTSLLSHLPKFLPLTSS